MTEEMNNEMQETADMAELASEVEMEQGIDDMLDAGDTLEAATDAEAIGDAAMAQAASDVTRGTDAMLAGDRLSALSEVVATAGVTDIAQGVELLSQSEDIAVQSALVASLSQDEMDMGMQLAAIAGQLEAVSDLSSIMNMPILSEFLDTKCDELHDLAVDTLLRFGATRALAQVMSVTSEEVAVMGIGEMEEGVVRVGVAEGMEEAGEELYDAGAELAVEGLDEAETAGAFHEAATDLAQEGVAEVAMAAEEIGEATTMGDLADVLEESVEEDEEE